jgi:arylsulfatase A-like enzyme
MTRRARLVAVFCSAAILVAGIAGWWGLGGTHAVRGLRARHEHPRIILVTFDTLNVWYTSLFSEDGAPTPNLEALAEEGVLFERAYTSVPITLPSHTALLSSRYPWSTGVLANGDRVPDEVLTLAEILSGHGYRTAAFLSLGVLSPSFNLDQGFDRYDPVPPRELGRWYRTADEVFEPAAQWISDHAREPVFVWLHLSDPHAPYLPIDAPPDTELRLDDEVLGRWTLGRRERQQLSFMLPPGRHELSWVALDRTTGAPVPELELLDTFELRRWTEETLEDGPVRQRLDPGWSLDLSNDGSEPVEVAISFRGRHLDKRAAWVRTRYRTEVTYADHYLGQLRRLIEEQDGWSDTLWVVASDHGEGLFHHGILGHAANNREEQLRTLCMLSGPGVPAGARLDTPPVLSEDILPTVLSVLGLPIPEAAEGQDLTPCWGSDGCGAPRREWISYGLSEDRVLRSLSLFQWPHKARWSYRAHPGVFQLEEDPRELAPIVEVPHDRRGLAAHAQALDQPFSGMLQELERSIRGLEAILARSEGRELKPEEIEMLESLGYL